MNFANLIKNISNETTTENGALAYKSTQDNLLDFFFKAPCLRENVGLIYSNVINLSKERYIRAQKYENVENTNAFKDALNVFKLAMEDCNTYKELGYVFACLFWLRDARGGAGEREAFRQIFKAILKETKGTILYTKLCNLAKFIPHYGRMDDLWNIFDVFDDVEAKVIKNVFDSILQGDDVMLKHSLGRWLPREKGKNRKLARGLATILDSKSMKNYRAFCTKLSGLTPETCLSQNRVEELDFSKVPSKCMSMNKCAFERHAPEKFKAYVENIKNGNAKVNANAIYPHEILKVVFDTYCSNKKAFYFLNNNFTFDYIVDSLENLTKEQHGQDVLDLMCAQWNAQPNYLDENIRILPIVDVSGSMYSACVGSTRVMDIACALGLYIAKFQNNDMKNLMVTFSQEPKFYYLKSKNILGNILEILESTTSLNTDLVKTMRTILDRALKNKVTQESMPQVVYILSDMQFDQATNDDWYMNTRNSSWNESTYETIKKEFEDHGYEMPRIVFHNLAYMSNVPMTQDVPGVSLVGGFSPSIMKYMLSGKEYTPMDQMNEVLESRRYLPIHREFA